MRPWARLGAALVLVAGVTLWLGLRAEAPPPRPAVLVVGDSLVESARSEISAGSAPGTISILAANGASPCDVWDGYRPAPSQSDAEISFRATLDFWRPRTVVFAFSGNAGVTGSPCFTAGTDYRLAGLVAAYRRAIDAMGVYAANRGAAVYLSAAPPRNPAVPEGWVAGVQWGFNGDPAFNDMLSTLAAARGWTYDTGAAARLSGLAGDWTLRLPCVAADGPFCTGGTVQVRYGTTDPIHFDQPGTNGAASPSAGALRFAVGLVTRPLADQGVAALGEPWATCGASAPCRRW